MADYKKYMDNLDETDPQMVIQTIQDILNEPGWVNEQKLYGIGLVLDHNKEQYILRIKRDMADLRTKMSEAETKHIHALKIAREVHQKEMREALKKVKSNAPHEHKKKVVVLKKKA